VGPFRLAWRQLAREKIRLLVVCGGVVFAVVLMLMQLGFQNSLYSSAVTLHRGFKSELFMISPLMPSMQKPNPFSLRRLYQAAGVPGVASVAPVYFSIASWRNPETGKTRGILMVAFDPAESVLAFPEVVAQQQLLKTPGSVLFDAKSRSEFGPIAAEFRAGRHLETECNDKQVFVAGLYSMGVSFSSDGNAIVGDQTFFDLFPGRREQVDIGTIRLKPGANLETVRDSIRAAVAGDVILLTRGEYIDREVTYWAKTTAIGFIFSFGVMIGFLVGSVIVYQILYSDVSDHLSEYATLKAIGYGDLYLSGVVLCEAVILSLLGFVPGVLLSLRMYAIAEKATQLPMRLEVGTALMVLTLTLAMCTISGVVALRKVRSADPASVF
jgi:putative ABC transport system permease protein